MMVVQQRRLSQPKHLAALTYLTFQVEAKGTPEEPAGFVLYQSNVNQMVF
jgi:hypothetical protein